MSGPRSCARSGGQHVDNGRCLGTAEEIRWITTAFGKYCLTWDFGVVIVAPRQQERRVGTTGNGSEAATPTSTERKAGRRERRRGMRCHGHLPPSRDPGRDESSLEPWPGGAVRSRLRCQTTSDEDPRFASGVAPGGRGETRGRRTKNGLARQDGSQIPARRASMNIESGRYSRTIRWWWISDRTDAPPGGRAHARPASGASTFSPWCRPPARARRGYGEPPCTGDQTSSTPHSGRFAATTSGASCAARASRSPHPRSASCASRRPQPAEPWTDVSPAVGRFPIVPQPLAGMEAAAGGAGGAEQSEAGCLTLNVWTPAADDARRPVLFWIHGGGFLTGAGTIPWYDGTNLARRDVVVVSCNYRLGALGLPPPRVHWGLGAGGIRQRGAARPDRRPRLGARQHRRRSVAIRAT